MATIQWRPEPNPLTTPQSWRIRFLPRSTAGISDIGGSLTADETLRIQVVQDLTEERLLFSLLDMEEDGATGEEVAVTENGTYTLPGFAGSAVGSLEIRVDHYLALWSMIRNDYGGRLVDVLEVQAG